MPVSSRRAWLDRRRALPPRVRVAISLQTMLLMIAVLAGVWLIYELLPIILVLVLSIFLVATLNPLVSALSRIGLRRPIAIGVVFFGLFAVSVLLGVLTLPPLGAQIKTLIEDFPSLQNGLADRLARVKFASGLADSVRGARIGEFASQAGKQLLAYSPRALEILAYGVSTLFIAIYLMIDRLRMRGALYAVVPRRYHLRLARVSLNFETIVGGYIRGQVITSAAMTVFVFLLLTACRVPNSIAFAVLAGAADILPFIGFIFLVGPAGIAAIQRGPVIVAVVILALSAYQEFENRVLVPRVYGRVLRLPPTVVIVALLVGGKLMGMLGAILALPVASVIRMLVEQLRVALPGEKAPDHALRERDERAEEEYAARAGGFGAREAADIALRIAERRRLEEDPDPEKAAEVPVTGGTSGGSQSARSAGRDSS